MGYGSFLFFYFLKNKLAELFIINIFMNRKKSSNLREACNSRNERGG